ncbi:MAG: transporter [Mycobacterium sp.]|nr:transporter [Mycobacterium sp.]
MSDDALQMRGPVNGTKDARRVAVGSGVGAVIETYDFIGFGTAAALYFGHAFFPGASPVAGTLASFATLGVGFAARPLGGIIGGHLGDKLGRKPVLVASLIVMGLATFAIGLLPTFAAVGILAPILLVVVRIVQGLAFGAEWGGAILMSYEHAPWKQKGKYTGIVQAGFPVGLLLANLVFLVSVHLGGDWAWRVPFLASIFLVIVGLIIRARVPESPVFEDVKKKGDIVRAPIVKVIKEDWRNIVRGIGLRIAETAGYAVSITYMISYLKNAELATKFETLTALCIASGIGIFATMGWARLTDKIGRRPSTSGPPPSPCCSAYRCSSGEHGPVHLDHRDIRRGLRSAAELDGRSPRRLVPRALPSQHPRLGSLTGLPDLGHGLRLHPLHHHTAVCVVRLGRTRAALQRLRRDRPPGGTDHPRDLGPTRAQARRRSRRPAAAIRHAPRSLGRDNT